MAHWIFVFQGLQCTILTPFLLFRICFAHAILADSRLEFKTFVSLKLTQNVIFSLVRLKDILLPRKMEGLTEERLEQAHVQNGYTALINAGWHGNGHADCARLPVLLGALICVFSCVPRQCCN